MTLGYLADLISVGTVLASFSDKLRRELATTGSPLEIATRKTVKRFESDFPAIGQQIRTFLTSPVAVSKLRQLVTAPQLDVDLLADVFRESVQFYLEPVEHAIVTARNIWMRFLEYLDRALLESNEVHSHRDRKDQLRHEQVCIQLEQIDQRMSLLDGAYVGSEEKPIDSVYKKQIAKAKEAETDGQTEKAYHLWGALLDILKECPRSHPEELFQVYLGVANCRARKGELKGAIEAYISAGTLQPNNVRAIRGLAIAALLEDDFEKAHSLISKALAESGDDNASLRIKAAIFLEEERYAEVFSLFGGDEAEGCTHLDDEACCRMLGYACYQLGYLQKAITILAQGLKLQPESLPSLNLLGTILIQPSPPGSDTTDPKVLKRGNELFSEAIEIAEARGDGAELARALAGKARALACLKQPEAGLAFADRAYSIQPDDEIVRFSYGLLSIAACSPVEARARFEQAICEYRDPQLLGMLLIQLGQGKSDLSLARTLVARLSSGGRATSLPPNVLLAFGEVLVKNNDLSEATTLLNELREADEETTSTACLLELRVLLAQRNESSAVSLAKAVLVDECSGRLVFRIADAFREAGYPKTAASFFERLGITERSDEALVRLYLRTLYEADFEVHEDKIFELATTFRQKRGADVDVTSLEVTILEKRGDMSTAQTVWRELLALEPGNSRYQLRLALCLMRLGKRGEASSQLEEVSSFNMLPAPDAMIAAHAFAELGNKRRAISVGYQAWRREQWSSTVNSRFIGLNLRMGDVNEVRQVTQGTAVEVKFDNGATQTFLILPDDEEPLLREEVRPSEDIAKKLVGRAVGAVVEWSPPPSSPSRATILSIKASELWACQNAFIRHPRLFPGDSSLKAISVDESFEDFFRIVDEHHLQVSKIVQNYRTKPTPLGLLRTQLGLSLVDTWRYVCGNPSLALLYSRNSPQELRRERSSFGRYRTAIVAPGFLMAIHDLGLLSCLGGFFDEIILAQQVFEDVQQTKSLLDSTVGRRGSIGKHNGRYTAHELSEEELRAQSNSLNELILGIQETMRPSGRPRQYSVRERDILAKFFGDDFLISIMLADEEEGVLLCDDALVREFAFKYYDVPGATSMQLLEVLFQQGGLGPDEYMAAVGNLLDWGYQHIPISEKLLSTIAQRTLEPSDKVFRLALGAAFHPHLDLSATIRVMIDFLRNCALELSTAVAESYLYPIAGLLFEAGGVRAVRRLSLELEKRISVIYLPSLERLRQTLALWEEGRLQTGHRVGEV